ncbi:uncharacterized protein LOC134619057 isoform X3 [Pelmatolapia mariae]|uniref:uncharacterized protein LOC134619057 isoform X3 n=1 Tax=Pelmatolapia mariae TaxID=158779 RepID=UPI002FE69C45
MKHTLVCFIFLTALQDGNTGLVKAQTLTHRAEEGGNITVACNFYFSGSRKLFCKEKCEKGNILVETSDDAAQNGRYSIKYVKTDTLSYIMYVSITQLNQSDSGRYRCSLDRVLLTDGNDDFELIVTEDVLIYVGLILVVMIVVLSAALLIFYMKRRTTKPRGPPVETDTQVDRLYEDIRKCDIPSRSPPVEVSSVYATSKDPRSDGVENIDLYSLVTSPQNNADNLCYTEVHFPHIPVTSSAPCGEATDVVYSMPQT